MAGHQLAALLQTRDDGHKDTLRQRDGVCRRGDGSRCTLRMPKQCLQNLSVYF